MNFEGTERLETERLILRKLSLDDAENMFKNWASDDEVTKYLVWEAHKNLEVTKEYLKNIVKEYENPKNFDWCIELKSIGEPIGTISCKGLDENVKKIEVGYCIGKRWWGNGITAEALKEVINFLIFKVGINRVEAYHDVRNFASGIVMQKAGMRFEGLLREAYMFKGGLKDVYIYSVLKKDLEAAKIYKI